MKLSTIKKNPNNPRVIKDYKFKQLVKSLQDFPEMMKLRPIVVDENNVVLGGNMRLAALNELKMKEIPDEWVLKASDLTEEQKREFIIKDNSGYGEWDWDILANEWSDLPLNEWGLDMPFYKPEEEIEMPQINPLTEYQITIKYEIEHLVALKNFINQNNELPLSPIDAGKKILNRIINDYQSNR